VPGSATAVEMSSMTQPQISIVRRTPALVKKISAPAVAPTVPTSVISSA